MQEITNEVYIECMRIAAEVVEGLELKEVESSIRHFTEQEKRAILLKKITEVESSIMNFTEQEKRAILSQKLAKVVFDSLTDTENLKEEG